MGWLNDYSSVEVLGLNSDAMVIGIMAGMLILSLLLSCCVGIAGSMEGILNKRRAADHSKSGSKV